MLQQWPRDEIIEVVFLTLALLRIMAERENDDSEQEQHRVVVLRAVAVVVAAAVVVVVFEWISCRTQVAD